MKLNQLLITFIVIITFSTSILADDKCISISLGGFIPSQKSIKISNGNSNIASGINCTIDYEYQLNAKWTLLSGFQIASTESKETLINLSNGTVGKIEYNYSALSCSAKYYLNPRDSIRIYGLGGLALSKLEIKFSGLDESDNNLGIYLGVGAERMISKKNKLGIQGDFRTGSKIV